MSLPSLYQRIMNIRPRAIGAAVFKELKDAYLEGHRDARHAAAEVVSEGEQLRLLDPPFEINRESASSTTYGWVEGGAPNRVKLAVVFEQGNVEVPESRLMEVGAHFMSILRTLGVVKAPVSQVELAEVIATEAHRGQVDKRGNAYIEHLKRVARYAGPQYAAVAFLHDVLEDTEITASDLRRFGINESVIRSVEILTRSEMEPYYMAYLEGIAKSGDLAAVSVKIADLFDNLRPGSSAAMRDARYLPALRRPAAGA